MIHCTTCGAEMPDVAQFCSKCGATNAAGASTSYAPPPTTEYSPTGGAATYNSPPMQVQQPLSAPNMIGAKAEPGIRAGSWVIDILALLLCMIPLILVGWIPFVGWIILWLGIPVVNITFHLLRDITGTSPGKFLLGLKVVNKNGTEAPTSARVLRNILFAIPGLCMFVPLVGHFIGILVGFVIVITEIIMLLTQNERVGDRFANTMVIRTK